MISKLPTHKSKIGEIEILSKIHNPAVGDFLGKLIRLMCSKSAEYFEAYYKIEPWHPLTLKERSMYALLASSVADISTPVFLSEIPTVRHARKGRGYAKDGTAGRVDLWTHYKRNLDIVLELKRESFGIKQTTLLESSRIIKKWHDVIGQVDSLSKDLTDQETTTACIGLLVVYGYRTKGENEKNSSPNATVVDTMQKIVGERLLEKAQKGEFWEGYWTPPSNMTSLPYIDGNGNEKTEINPVVGFYAYVRNYGP